MGKQKVVHLGADDCCAMLQAFICQRALVDSWSDAIGRVRLKNIATGLVRTVALDFQPDAETMAILRSFASAELERLSELNHHERLPCGHTHLEHHAVLEKLLPNLPLLLN